MAYSHCMAPETGPGTMGLYIMPITIHTTQGQGQGQGPMGCIPNSMFSVPVPVSCSLYEPLHRYWKLLFDENKDTLIFFWKM